MTNSTPIWNDPTFRRFFARAEETIAHERELLAQPWRGMRDRWLHDVINEICGAESESRSEAAA